MGIKGFPILSVKFGDYSQNRVIKLIIIPVLAMGLFMPITASANITCQGRFVNPITDICWSCILPISIGSISIGKGATPKKSDTKNPSSPVCMCTKSNIPLPGITIGFWEPARLVDVTRIPYCMTNLGGISLGSDHKRTGSHNRNYADHSYKHDSFYHVHYYIYPLIYWLELITDFICLERNSFDVAYMSEFDVTWKILSYRAY